MATVGSQRSGDRRDEAQPGEDGLLLTRVITGDAAIDAEIARPGVVVFPARACNIDGFVDDTMTEYANPSVYRPPSVRQARLVSSLSAGNLMGQQHGVYHVGLVIYDAKDQPEEFAIWVKDRQLGLARADANDNRRHLHVLPRRLHFRGSELLRFYTAPSDGPHRIEAVVLLPELPAATSQTLAIRDPRLQLWREPAGGRRAVLTWLTNRPAHADVTLRVGGATFNSSEPGLPLVNHEVVFASLPADGEARARIECQPAAGTGLPEDARTFAEVEPEVVPPSPTGTAAEPIALDLIAAADTPADGAGTVRSWPVTWGIPFAPGVLASTESLRVMRLDSAGNRLAVPCQARVQRRWPDGTVCWSLIDFRAELDQTPGVADDGARRDGRLASFVVESQPDGSPPPAAADAVVVEETPALVRVSTGPLRVDIPRDELIVPGRVFLRDETTGEYRPILDGPAGGTALLEDADGVCYGGVVDAVAVEEAGSERAVVRVEAHHASADGRRLFRSIFRVHVFRGERFVRVFHTFENDRVEDTFTRVRSLVLRSGLAVGGASVARLEEDVVTVPGDVRRVGIVQEKETYTLRHHDGRRRDVEVPGHATGTLSIDVDDGRGALVHVRNFWQNYPKALAAEPGAVEVGICPPLRADAFAPGDPDEHRLYYYLVDGVYRFKWGMARTHELLYAFYRDEGERAEAAAQARLFEAPPVVRVPVEVYTGSGGLSEVLPKDWERVPAWERWVDAALTALDAEWETYRDYGMLNFGDWFGERRHNWGNLEYDNPIGYLVEYLRGGDGRWFRLAEQAVRHLSDVDTIHHCPDAALVGGQYNHAVGHVGDYYARGLLPGAFMHGRVEHDHTWVEGQFLLALLTGDRRIRETAILTTRRIGGPGLNDFDYGNGRDAGWPLIHLMAGYRATGERFYLNGARVIVERALERQRPWGGWDRQLIPGHCFCEPPRHRGEAAFMIGILLEGLKRYHQATGDERVAAAIVRGAAHLVNDLYAPESALFRYTSCPFSSSGPAVTILEGIVYAYRLARDPGIGQVSLKVARMALGAPPLEGSKDLERRLALNAVPRGPLDQYEEPAIRGVGKEVGAWMRALPHILYDLVGLIDGVGDERG